MGTDFSSNVLTFYGLNRAPGAALLIFWVTSFSLERAEPVYCRISATLPACPFQDMSAVPTSQDNQKC